MRKTKSTIGFVIAILLIILLANPAWLPFSQETIAKINEIRQNSFLLEGSWKFTMAHLLNLLFAFAIVWVVYTILKFILAWTGDRDEHARTISGLLTGLLRYLAVITAVIWGLSILGVDTMAVLAGVGILGLIIGFASQSLIEDIITGLFIIFEHQYSIGDIIILDDFRGTVRNIGVRTTVIEDAGGNLKIVNNSDIRNFQNRSRIPSLALSEPSVSYSTDLRYLEEVLKKALPKMYQKHSDLYLEEPVYYGVTQLGDSGVTVRIGAYVKEENIFIAQRQLNRDLKLLFDENGIEIPFPQVVVHNAD